jgi:hypothetical protein
MTVPVALMSRITRAPTTSNLNSCHVIEQTCFRPPSGAKRFVFYWTTQKPAHAKTGTGGW